MEEYSNRCDQCTAIVYEPHFLPISYTPPETNLKYISASNVAHSFKQLIPITDDNPGTFSVNTEICCCSPECLLKKASIQFPNCLTNIYLKYPKLKKE